MSSELEHSGFHSRLAKLIGSEKPFAWAERVGINKATFHRIWTGEAMPGYKHLVKIHDETGVSINWLLTGEGEMGGSGGRRASEFDQERLIQAVETVEAALLETGRTMTPRKKGEMIAAVYAFFGEEEASEEARSNVLRLIKSAV